MEAGCATRALPVDPGSGLPAPPTTTADGTADDSPLPPSVEENQTFVTLEGVPRYKIGPGEVLEVLLTRGLPQDRQTAVVRANGMVSVAFVEAKVGGQTAEQAAEEIRRVLSPYYKQLGVEVLVKEYNSKKVTVLGALGGTGGGGGVLPLKGKKLLPEALAEAGGPAPNADLERVRVIRPDGSVLRINLLRLLSQGRTIPELALDRGDIVFVPARRQPAEPKFFVLGEVRHPGGYPLVVNMRLSQVLAVAGGPTDVAVLESARIVRGGAADPKIVGTDFRKVIEQGDMSQDLEIQANDLIFLPRSAIGDWNAFLGKIRPTIEILTLPLAGATEVLLIQDLIRK